MLLLEDLLTHDLELRDLESSDPSGLEVLGDLETSLTSGFGVPTASSPGMPILAADKLGEGVLTTRPRGLEGLKVSSSAFRKISSEL